MPAFRPLAAFAAFVLAGVAIVACRGVVGVESRRSARAEAGPPPDPCTACLDERCADESTACAASSSCAARSACLAVCASSDVACRATCTTSTGGEDFGALASLASCRATSCAPECGVTCGDVPTLVDPSFVASCASCVQATCCAALSACAASSDCLRAVECTRANDTPDAIRVCQKVAWPAGSDAYAAVDACLA